MIGHCECNPGTKCWKATPNAMQDTNLTTPVSWVVRDFQDDLATFEGGVNPVWVGLDARGRTALSTCRS